MTEAALAMQINVLESLAERVRFEYEASANASASAGLSVGARAPAAPPRVPSRPIVLRLDEAVAGGSGGSGSVSARNSSAGLLSSLPSARGSRLRAHSSHAGATKDGSASATGAEPASVSGAARPPSRTLPFGVSARPGTAGS